MGTININGKTYVTNGGSICITDNYVIIDGKVVSEKLSGIVKVVIEGDLASLKTDVSATVNGDVTGNVNCNGSCTCGKVEGSVKAGGSVTCGKVKGGVHAGGSVSIS